MKSQACRELMSVTAALKPRSAVLALFFFFVTGWPFCCPLFIWTSCMFYLNSLSLNSLLALQMADINRPVITSIHWQIHDFSWIWKTIPCMSYSVGRIIKVCAGFLCNINFSTGNHIREHRCQCFTFYFWVVCEMCCTTLLVENPLSPAVRAAL